MTPAEFVSRSVRTPWVRGGSDWDGTDCFGLVVMWHRQVLGVDLGYVAHTDIESGFSASSMSWESCDIEAGATCFMGYQGEVPAHCGIVLDGLTVLHAQGGAEACGRVRVSSIALLRRLYTDIKFFRYKNADNHQ